MSQPWFYRSHLVRYTFGSAFIACELYGLSTMLEQFRSWNKLYSCLLAYSFFVGSLNRIVAVYKPASVNRGFNYNKFISIRGFLDDPNVTPLDILSAFSGTFSFTTRTIHLTIRHMNDERLSYYEKFGLFISIPMFTLAALFKKGFDKGSDGWLLCSIVECIQPLFFVGILNESRKIIDAPNPNEQKIRVNNDDVHVDKFIWEWEDDTPNEWRAYNGKTGEQISKLEIGKTYEYKGMNNQKYRITKLKQSYGEQRNMSTNVKRRVRRTQISKNIQYPPWWNMDAIKDYAQPALISLDLNTNNYKAQEIIKDFNSTANQKIVKIESVQNKYLYDKWWDEKERLLKLKNGDTSKINEKILYHGTDKETMQKILKGGFRKEFTSTTLHGEGTYFAIDASYSASARYSPDKKMLQCNVLCGESTKGNSSISLKTWPKKKNGHLYDSLVDSISNPTMHVIHEDARALPMFVIHFK
eukprot:471986_1